MSDRQSFSPDGSGRPDGRHTAELWPTRMLGALRDAVAVVFLGDLAP
jgi:hypothetical protein